MPVVLILDGNSVICVHVRSNLCYLIVFCQSQEYELRLHQLVCVIQTSVESYALGTYIGW